MNTSGCPACCWLLCLQYICVVLNHLASPTLQGICPVQALEGTTPDISFMLHFSFYEPVYYRIDSSEPDLNFPSSSNEKKGYWVGFADSQGDRLTWRILTEDTQEIIIRSGIQGALRTTTNQHLASHSGEGTTLPLPIPYPQQSTNSLPLDLLDESTPNFEQFVKSQSGEDEDNPIHMANIDIPNLLGRSFLLPPEDNGDRHMAKIIDIDDHGQPLEDIKFKLKINKDQAEEIMSYNQLMDYIQKGTDAEEDPDSLFKFRDIVAHQGPLESTDPDHKGSKYNVMVEWESGEVTYEPLTLISNEDPITCAVYAKKHDLIDTTGWKHLKRYTIHQVDNQKSPFRSQKACCDPGMPVAHLYQSLHLLKCFILFLIPLKLLLSHKIGQKSKNVSPPRPHVMIVIYHSKERWALCLICWMFHS